MQRRGTRLEFVIITVVFLVLMLSSKPPQPGSAEIEDAGQPELGSLDTESPVSWQTLPNPEPEPETSASADTPATVAADPQPETEPLELIEPVEPDPPAPRVGLVDARNCEGLNYDDIMAGEITVRWVWDGQKLAPEKVCVVHEPDGGTTVWRFNQQGRSVLAEIDSSQNPAP